MPIASILLVEAIPDFPKALSAGAKPLLLSISALQMMEETAYIFYIFFFPMNSAQMEPPPHTLLLIKKRERTAGCKDHLPPTPHGAPPKRLPVTAE